MKEIHFVANFILCVLKQNVQHARSLIIFSLLSLNSGNECSLGAVLWLNLPTHLESIMDLPSLSIKSNTQSI